MGSTLPALAAPITPRQAWTRLALLLLTLAMTLGALLLSLTWLWPTSAQHTFEVPLSTLAVGVPQFFRPFEMGGSKGRPYGVWLVRSDGNAVTAFWSAVPHPNACGVEVAQFYPTQRTSPPVTPRATPTPLVPPAGLGGPSAAAPPAMQTGFRDPCHGLRYLLDGRGDHAPVFRGLDSFPVTIVGGIVRIDTSRRILGPCEAAGILDDCSTPTRTITVRHRTGW